MPAVVGIWLALTGVLPVLVGLSGMRRIRRLRRSGVKAWAVAALGDATRSELDPDSSYFGVATATALEKLQSSLGWTQTGSLQLGQVVFLPTAAEVSSVSATLGAPVSVVLPDNQTTPGVVTSISPIASSAPSGGGSGSSGSPGNSGSSGSSGSSVATVNVDIGAALAIGALAGLLPALRAARMSPTQALWAI